ncbi:MAG: alanine racemase [Phycisphaerales bacterium]
MSPTSLIHIDLGAVHDNMRVLRRVVGRRCALCAILKADGYGLGARPLAVTLARAGADLLAVYTLQQAQELARESLTIPIMVLMPVADFETTEALEALLAAGRLHLTVHAPSQMVSLAELAARLGLVLPVHLEVDTGMSRGGCSIDEAPAIVHRITDPSMARRLRLAGLFTHFADIKAANPVYMNRQAARFEAVVDQVKDVLPLDCLIHAANSVATLRAKRFHKSMVRVGQAWAGYGVDGLDEGEFLRMGRQLRPAVSWTSRIVHVKTIEPGTPVGYRCTWTAKRRSRIGLVPVGHADGYPTALGTTDTKPGPACVGVVVDEPSTSTNPRHYVPVIGAVNMDQITIDLTDIDPPADPGVPGRIPVGTAVELISTDPSAPNHLPTLALAAGIVPHVLLAGLSSQLPRVYHADRPTTRKPASAPPALVS